jgi:hypothetical protein
VPFGSIFRREDCDAIVARIRSVTPASPRQWGKMQPGQMLAHCQVPIEVALGEKRLKRGLLGVLFGRLARKTLLRDEPTKKGLPTDEAFRIRDSRDVGVERERLLVLVERLSKGGPAALTPEPHPFFGPMTVAEWDALMWKHLDHHLRQFGA